MKYVVKKDLRPLLPAFASAFMAGVGLSLITLFAAFSGNGDFTTTALMFFFIAMILVSAYIIFKNAILYRNNLGDDEYMKGLLQNNITHVQFPAYKMISALIQCLILITEYIILFGICVFVATKKIQLFDRVLAKNDFFSIVAYITGNQSVPGTISTYLEIVFMAFAVATIAFSAYGLCYTYFIRGKYAGIAGIMTFFPMFWLAWKIYDTLVPTVGDTKTIISILVCLVFIVLNFVINIFVVSRKRYKLLKKELSI